MSRKKKFDKIDFPIVKNIQPKLLADEIFPYIPGNKKNMAAWDKIFKDIFDPIRQEFKDKGIPWPRIIIDSTPGPITYGVKTVDENGKTIHSQFNVKDDEDIK